VLVDLQDCESRLGCLRHTVAGDRLTLKNRGSSCHVYYWATLPYRNRLLPAGFAAAPGTFSPSSFKRPPPIRLSAEILERAAAHDKSVGLSNDLDIRRGYIEVSSILRTSAHPCVHGMQIEDAQNNIDERKGKHGQD